MDPYNPVQEQLVSLNNTIQSSFQKLSEELAQVSRRLHQIEQHTSRNTANVGALNEQINFIKTRAELIPKIYNNQFAQFETLLRGHQYQYKSISNILSRGDDTPFTDVTQSLSDQSQNSNSLTQQQQQQDDDDDELDDVTHTNGDHHHHITMERVGAPAPQQNNTGRIAPQNRVNQSPVNMSLMETNSARSGNSSQRTQNTSVNSSSLPRFNIMTELSNDQMTLPNLQAPGAGNDDTLTNINEVVEDESRRMWDGVPFRKLNPHPKSVDEVMNEYYYGYQAQPPLKYLEKYRKDWRKGNKNLSKTFCRRYRIITAVEHGIRQYRRENGMSEDSAREKIVSELENMRIKENGKKETMYWLFHHVPQHLKRR